MTDNRKIRILCVDDHSLMAEGLRTRIGLEKDLEFSGWLNSAENLLEEVRRAAPDIILLDIEMPGPDPFDVLVDLKWQYPETRTIMFSAYVRDHYIDAAFKGGAWGYLSKSDEPEQVIALIRRVAAGEFAFGPKVLERCKPLRPGAAARETQPGSSRLSRLTKREVQILRLIGKGMSRLEIARAISRSPKTVDNHRAAIMEKLGIRDRVELARFAISEGLVEP